MKKMKNSIRIISLIIIALATQDVLATSDTFPQTTNPPTVADFLPTPNHTYYCSPTGNNGTGNGTIGNPWLDLIGANAEVSSGDLIYLRGGDYPAYPYENFSRSRNILRDNGTSTNPIVITNYPGEIVKWNDTHTWALTLSGANQKFIGTKVGEEFGIQISGGISFREDNIQISGIEFIGGTSNGGDINPAMVSQPLNGNRAHNGVISHNYFHDSQCVSASGDYSSCHGAPKMSGIRVFSTAGLLVEYNLFENMKSRDGGVVYFKDSTQNATVRYNRFINGTDADAITFFGQDTYRPSCSGLDIHDNLINNYEHAFNYRSEYTPDLRIYNNIVLDTDIIYHYRNSGNQEAGPDNGEVYNNILDGRAFSISDGSSANNTRHLPTYWDYNMWQISADRVGAAPVAPNNGWAYPVGYSEHAVTNRALGIIYNATTRTVTADDNYPGLGAGRTGDNIGGLVFSGTDTTHPILTQTTPIPTPTSNTTPDYTFNSSEAGTITYTGDCSSSTTSAQSGNNTITLNSLADGTYSNCKITVTDNSNNISDPLSITTFTINSAPTSSTKADVDLSGSIDIIDALLTFRNSLELDMTATTWKASATGDSNCDGTSNSVDVRLILRDSLDLDMSGTGWCVD